VQLSPVPAEVDTSVSPKSRIAPANDDAKLPGCGVSTSQRWKIPIKSVNSLPGETYQHPPNVKYQIDEDGTVSDIKLIRSSGITDIDIRISFAAWNWKYKPRPGCGIVETETSVIIDWN
jgi:hypothetical protein